MPGDDLADALRFTCSELSIPFLPDLPARGPHTTMTGRAMAVTEELDADIRTGRWRLTDGASLDQRRAHSQLGHDLDILEEQGVDAGTFKIQISGPLTLAAAVELPRGGLVLGDHGAVRELAQALGQGVGALITEVRNRTTAGQLIVQVDEPYAPAVMAGRVRTVSGYATHPPLDETRADVFLRAVTDVIDRSGAVPSVHCCAPDIPADTFIGAGFTAISFQTISPDEGWARAVEEQIELWPQFAAIASGDVDGARHQLDAFVRALGFSLDTVHDQLVVTPPCGLESGPLHGAKTALQTAQRLASS